MLFRGMSQVGASVLAVGHHADDQVETSLMRLGRGTSELGAAGMRRRRRWGMGVGADEHALGWAGYQGMNRWMIRPLLEFGKVCCTFNSRLRNLKIAGRIVCWQLAKRINWSMLLTPRIFSQTLHFVMLFDICLPTQER